MTISSSLNAGVSGLTANSTRLAAISDNIANSATNGYKRTEVDFASLVIAQRAGFYSAGGVRAEAFKDVAQAGSLISTSNSTDIAINGRGLLPTTNISGVTQTSAQRDLHLVPTGSFRPDENGFLTTVSGEYLLGWPADTNGNIGSVSRDTTSALQPVNVNVNQVTALPTTDIDLGINLPAEATDPSASGESLILPVEYYDELGRTETVTFTFVPDTSGATPSNSWTINITDSANADPTLVIGTLNIVFNETGANAGTPTTITPGAGVTYDAATGEITYSLDKGPITTSIGRVDQAGGLTQLAGPFSPFNVAQNGAPIGDLQSIEITEQGFLEAVYNTGFRRTLYQIPVADVPNLNGLTALNNQAYSISSESGDLFFWNAGEGPTGTVSGFSLLESATDIASELTSLIETQRAYSSNATIIRTVDEMLQETTNLKR